MTPVFELKYNAKLVNRWFDGVLTTIRFTDYLENRVGELELTLADVAQKFLDDYYPQANDKLELRISHDGDSWLDCGTFWVDEIINSGDRSGTLCIIRAVSGKAQSLHQSVQNKIYQDKKFEDVAKELGEALGYEVVGDLDGTITSVPNTKDKPLGYLKRESQKLGKIMKLEREQLVFYDFSKFDKKSHQLIISLKDALSYNIKDTAAGRYSRCTCRWRDTKTKKTYVGSYDNGIANGGEATIYEKVESSAEAKEQAKKWLEDKNKQQIQLTINTIGDIRIQAGVSVKLNDAGRFSKNYYADEVTHELTKSGYKTKMILR